MIRSPFAHHGPRVLALMLLAAAVLPAAGDCVLPAWTRGSVLNRNATRVHPAELNGDGRPDLIGHDAEAIFVALNDGTGAFAAMTDIHTGAILGPVVVGDFTGDTKTDVAFGTNGSLVVLPGFGDGTFAPAITTSITITPTSTMAATLDPGSTLDLLVYDTILNVLLRYTNDGSGQFAEASRMTLVSDQETFATADFDGDGRTDTIVASPGLTNYEAFYAAADGSFGSPTAVRGALSASKLGAPDLDGDARPDLLVATTGAVVALRNLGGRAFTDPLRYNDTAQLLDVETADFTGDGFPDAATFSSGCRFRIWKGTGLGTLGASSQVSFTIPDSFCFSTGRADAAVADFDGDGRQDLVFTATPENVPQIRFYRNRCGDSEVRVDEHPALLTAGDDATVELFVEAVGHGYSTSRTGTVSILENGVPLATGPLVQSEARLPVGGLALGTHQLVAAYSGNTAYEPSESEPFTINVTTETTTTTLAVTPLTGVYGHGPSITASVTGNGQVTGTIRFSIDGVLHYTGSAPVYGFPGLATSTVGTHTVLAEYSGDATHPPSRATRTYTIGKQVPTIRSDRASALAGETPSMHLNAMATGNVLTLPSGTFSIGNGSTTYDTQPLQNGTASATLTMPALAPGRYALLARYSGDANFAAVETWLSYIVFAPGTETIDARGTAAGVTTTWNSTKTMVEWGRPSDESFDYLFGVQQPLFQTSLMSETVYLYRLNGGINGFSPQDVAMRIGFTDDPLLRGMPVRATHMIEIVRAVNILRAAANLAPVSNAPFTAGSPVSAASLLALRNAINEARLALDAYPYAFSSTLGAGLVIRASDIQELREAVR